jgi:hypothetical protein
VLNEDAGIGLAFRRDGEDVVGGRGDVTLEVTGDGHNVDDAGVDIDTAAVCAGIFDRRALNFVP